MYNIWQSLRFAIRLGYVTAEFKSVWRSSALQRLGIHQNLALKIAGVYAPLHAWMRYCDVCLADVLAQGSQDILELFIWYVKLVDALIDSPDGRQTFLADPAVVRTHPQLAQITSALVALVGEAGVPKKSKRLIIEAIHSFRTQAIRTCTANARLLSSQRLPLASLLAYREATSGLMYMVFARVLNLLHDIPPEKGRKAEEVMACWGLAAQVLDDLGDVQADYRHDQNNILWTVIHNYPDERETLAWTVSSNSAFAVAWLPSICPRSYREVENFMEQYLGRMIAIDPQSLALRQTAIDFRSALQSLSSHTSARIFSRLAAWAVGMRLS